MCPRPSCVFGVVFVIVFASLALVQLWTRRYSPASLRDILVFTPQGNCDLPVLPPPLQSYRFDPTFHTMCTDTGALKHAIHLTALDEEAFQLTEALDSSVETEPSPIHFVLSNPPSPDSESMRIYLCCIESALNTPTPAVTIWVPNNKTRGETVLVLHQTAPWMAHTPRLRLAILPPLPGDLRVELARRPSKAAARASDWYRLQILLRLGGLYLDLDHLILSPKIVSLPDFVTNGNARGSGEASLQRCMEVMSNDLCGTLSAPHQSGFAGDAHLANYLANSPMRFTKGSTFLHACLADFSHQLQRSPPWSGLFPSFVGAMPFAWLGPAQITRVFVSSHLQDNHISRPLLLPPRVVIPCGLDWPNPARIDDCLTSSVDALAVHFYNKQITGVSQQLDAILQQRCPETFQNKIGN